MGLVLALVLIVMGLGGFYMHALWWAAPAVAALGLVAILVRAAVRRARSRGDRSQRQRDGANVDAGRAPRSRLNV